MKRLFVITVVMVFTMIPLSSSAEMIGGGNIRFAPPNADPVFFSHEFHVNTEKLKCTACHYHTFQMSREAHKAYKMDMKKITKGSFCGRCHNGEMAFDVKDPKSWTRCHKKQ
jgi:c(7)-type cytochrome triheme protein